MPTGYRITALLQMRLLAAGVVALLLAACSSDEASEPPFAPTLLEQTTVGTVSAADLLAAMREIDASGQVEALIGAPLCDIEIVRIAHTTNGPAGEATTATAALLLPRQPEGSVACPTTPKALVAWSRATEYRREVSLADPQASETLGLAAVFVAQGYVALATDNLGLGGSDLDYHPYLNANAAASVLIDAIRVARGALQQRELDTVRLFVAGYSQGGHGAMATARELERNWQETLPLLATAAMTGPFALEDLLLTQTRTDRRGATAALSYLLTGWQRAYGNLWDAVSDAFREPWAGWIETLLPTTAGSESALYSQGLLPLATEDLLTESFLSSFENDPDAAARVAARRDSFYGSLVTEPWVAQRPVFLCAGSKDPVVPYWNTELAYDALRMASADVTRVDVDALLTLLGVEQDDYHVAAAIPCIIAARSFFERP